MRASRHQWVKLPSRGWEPPLRSLIPVVALLVVSACGARNTTHVSPDQIPALQSQLSVAPDNGQLLLRYAAALFTAGKCDSAVVVAERGSRLRSGDALAPLVIGQCAEQSEDYDRAIAVYGAFVDQHPNATGAAAVGGREIIASRAQATAAARSALENESNLASRAVDSRFVAVLPLVILGDSSMQPLSRGLAQIITSDLGLLHELRMVERLRIDALIEEMHLARTGAVDRSTAARLGRLTQAGRMVQGLASIPPDESVRLEASVVVATGEVTAPASVDGELRHLMRLEKELVIGIAEELGYVLSEAERQRILENGTQNLTAFLAYSRGLEAMEDGNYNAAAAHFGQAAQADPNFGAARELQTATAGAAAVSQSNRSDIMVISKMETSTGNEGATQHALTSTVGDVAWTQPEQLNEQAGGTMSNPSSTPGAYPPPTASILPGLNLKTLRIILRMPR